MNSNAAECTSTDNKPTTAVDAKIMSTVDMLQAFTLRDSSDDASKLDLAQDTDLDVDPPTNETTQANEMDIDPSQNEHLHYPSATTHHHSPSTGTTANPDAAVLERKSVRMPESASKPQHKHLKHLVGVDAKSKAPAAFSLDRVVAASVQRSSKQDPLQRPSCTDKARQSRLAQAAMEALDQEA
jgi:hypothetical protein